MLNIIGYSETYYFVFVGPSIGLLEDSAAVLEKGLLMDPLRLSLQFRNTDKGVTDSTAMDDLMCTGKMFIGSTVCILLSICVFLCVVVD